MNKKLTEQELRELERQLSCPEGEKGLKVANKMNDSNVEMTLNSFEFLSVVKGNTLLELGFGNCGHLEKLFEISNDFKYFGLEISETMCEEAKKININKKASFQIYDGKCIPFPDNFFDTIFSVNTIYFWVNPKEFIKEIQRVLRPNGCCVLTFANESFMKNLPFVGEQFTLYDVNKLNKLLENIELKVIEFKELTEQVTSKSGESVKRIYTMVKIGF